MSLLSCALAAALISAPPPSLMGSIYGKVVAKASHYVTTPSEQNGFAHRLASPATPMREPMGVIVALEGVALEKEKFDAPTDEVKIEAKALGLEPRLVGCMVGSPLSIQNNGTHALKIKGSTLIKDTIGPKEAKKWVLDEVGVFEIFDAEQPEAKITVVVTQNPFVITLDETGEFLFEDLTPGPYTLRIYTRTGSRQVPVMVKPQEREQITIALKTEKAKK